jgi:Helix-turn-helix of DDE superfamily endonuclease
MKTKSVEKLSAANFRRMIGVKRETFNEMVKIVDKAMVEKKAKGGRSNKLDIPSMVLMTLEYLREYRTYAVIGLSYGLSESSTYKTIKWVEDVLIKSNAFSLPGKKALQNSENEFEVILIDATETPIERPSKKQKKYYSGKKKDIR